MTPTRRVLLVLVGVLALLAAALLWEVLGTVFFAVTLVYVATPLYRGLLDRGWAPWWASAATTAAVAVSAVALVAPFAIVLYQRRGNLVALLESLPEGVVVGALGFEYTVVTVDVVRLAVDLLRTLALGTAAAAPVIGVKATLLAMVLFALLIRGDATGRALLAAVPGEYRWVARRLNRRLRETLLAIYVLQAATGLATFAVALPLFALLGYPFPLVIAVLAGLLQFLPIVGPSVVIAVLVAVELLAGDPVAAALVGVLGWVLVAFLPDVVVRPRLAERTARVPGSLYFVGFAGGLLTVGAVGIIAGPVAVVLLHEAVGMLADETNVAPGGQLVEE